MANTTEFFFEHFCLIVDKFYLIKIQCLTSNIDFPYLILNSS